ncbi:monocarboxylate transporter 7-like [Diadema setosum]|uniref:monocarboxylate transporter 7-like n=1 Tax=Diadema setosum TaxID=31175 RepID=UPI003B3BA826
MENGKKGNKMAARRRREESQRSSCLSKGVRRWIILLSASFNAFLELGNVRAIGVIINDSTAELRISTAFTGTVISVSAGLMFSMAIFITPLLRKFSPRQLVMFGGTLSSLGLVLSSFAQNGGHFAATFSLYGLGFCSVIVISNSVPAMYFPDLFEVAAGINVTGGAIGVLVLPVLMEKLYEAYGWRGALLLLGAVNFHSVSFGALLRPRSGQICKREGGVENGQTTTDGTSVDVINLQELPSTSGSRDDASAGNANPGYEDDEQIEESMIDDGARKPRKNAIWVSESSGQISTRRKTVQPCSTPGTVLVKEDDEVCPSVDDSSKTTKDYARRAESTKTKASERRQEIISSAVSCLGRAARFFHFQVFKDEFPSFTIAFIGMILFGTTYNALTLFIIPNAVAKGLGGLSVYVSLTEAIGDALGRLGFAILTSRKNVRVEILYLTACVILTGAMFINALATSLWSLAVVFFICGLCYGAMVSGLFIVLKELLGTHQYESSVALAFFAVGIGAPISGVLFGSTAY